MFMHGGLLHLGGNMLFLWIFGNNVEDSMGPVRYLAFYLLGGLAATRCRWSSARARRCRTSAPRARSPRVLAGYLVLFPRARVVTFVFIIFFFTIIELPGDHLPRHLDRRAGAVRLPRSRPASGGGGGVAYFAHIGGFAFGLAADQAVRLRARTQRQLERAGMA